MDATFLMFDWRSFRERWGTRGILAKRPRATVHFEFHYGICEKLTRHKYLLPFHVPGYGFGNLLTDGEHPIAWHQWYGAYRKRLGAVAAPLAEVARSGEQAFLADYPALRLSRAVPAWGPGLDIEIERASLRHVASEGPARWASLRRWYGYGVRGLVSRVLAKLDRWRRLH
jgi:hypothetical protein